MFICVIWEEIKPLVHFTLFYILSFYQLNYSLVLQNQNFDGLRDVKLFIWQFIN